MQKIKRIVVAGEDVAQVDIAIWEGATFVIRVGRGKDITFRNQRIEDEAAYCELVDGEETLRKLREAAA